MAGFDVGLGDLDVSADHVHAGVAKEYLEGVGVAAIAEVVDGEGVAKAVDVGVVDSGALGDGGDGVVEMIAGEGLAVAGDEEGVIGGFGEAGGEVAPDGGGGVVGEGEGAFFGSFAEDAQAPVSKVEVVDAGGAEFGGAQAGVEQEQEYGAVALCVGEGVGGGTFARAGVGFGFAEGADHKAQVRFGIGDDGALLLAWAFDLMEGVRIGVAVFDGPGPEGGQAGVVVEAGFLGEVGVGDEEALDVLGGDF